MKSHTNRSSGSSKLDNFERMQIRVDSLPCIAENLLKRKCDGAQRYREFLRQVGEQSLAATEDREARQDQSDQSWLVATLVGAEFESEFNALALDAHLRHLTV